MTFLRILLLTAMRCGELAGMSWHQVNFENRTLKVGRAKTSSGTGRVIPMNNELYLLLSHHLDWYKTAFGKTEPRVVSIPFWRQQAEGSNAAHFVHQESVGNNSQAGQS